ncbi:MAG: hypothetical protein Q4D53_05270, partial [Leptotrichiaceae bacterium]|nr:hypothetical protein [Leptotrichiaceae bacterium]
FIILNKLKKERKYEKSGYNFIINNRSLNFFQNRQFGNKENKEFFINMTKLPDKYYEYGQKESGENFGCSTTGYFLIVYKTAKEINNKDAAADVSFEPAETGKFIQKQTGKYI